MQTEFQRIARRDKKTFFNEQCIKIEANSRKGKTIFSPFFKKIGNTKEYFTQIWAQ